MARITYFPRYTTQENVVTNTTLHLFSQINQHSADRLRIVLSDLLGGEEIPLGINFQQQTRSGSSVPDGSILQEPIRIILETKVNAGVDVDQLIRHCDNFTSGRAGNFLVLLTKNEIDSQVLRPIFERAKEIGVIFRNMTFERLCDSLKGLAREYETHLTRVIEDYAAYCVETNLLPDRRKWLRIVPCGLTFDLNKQWHVYYQPTDRGYSPHEYIGIYNQKAVRLFARVAAIYDNKLDSNGQMQLTLVDGSDRPEFQTRIEEIVSSSEEKTGWELKSDYRFFCVEEFFPTEFKKTSWGGIQGARFWDISEQITKAGSSDLQIAELLRQKEWQ